MIRVLLISAAIPKPTFAGHVVLHRHLIDRDELELNVLLPNPENYSSQSLTARLAKSRLHRFVYDFLHIRQGLYFDRRLPQPPSDNVRSVVMTVGQDYACLAAKRYAARNGLPLVTFFHDWWPDMLPLHSWFKKRAESEFVSLYKASRLALCVSPGMKFELGDHPNSHVLYPIPAKQRAEPVTVRTSEKFRVVYSGNLFTYGPMLMTALEALKDDPRIRLEVRGADPNWPEGFKADMKARGLWLDFAPRPELEAWLASANAFLIPQSFTEKDSKSMRTNFPSKLVDFSIYSKPFVVWAPTMASAAVWAAQGDNAQLVASASPAELRAQLHLLAENPARQLELSQRSHTHSHCMFNESQIQSQFSRLLNETACTKTL